MIGILGAMGLAVPEAQRFGKYTLVAKLATGGMAEIFLARLQGAGGFEKLVCIKRILPQYAKDPQFVAMFLAEAKIAAQISHPNVCAVFELGEIDGQYFIAMEYLEGVPLACFRRKDLYAGEPEVRLVAGLGLQACEGLHHAHQLKRPDGTLLEVVHRDVSGNNLFATIDGVVKVLDFGIAKVQDTSVRTTTGSVKGTYAYMAPEQLRGEKIDRRTDVFALGIVLWELLCRRHLFKRETDYLTFQAITTEPIPDACELRPDVPPALAAAIAKALARKPDDRHANARMFGEAIAQSVGMLGGPLAASGISEEVERAFEGRLRDQRGLIKVAREGGTLDLGDDRGPAIGHGTELFSTPLSIVSGLQRHTEPEVSRPPATASVPRAPIPAGPTSLMMPTAPPPSRVPWIVAIVALAVAAGALALWSQHGSSPSTAVDMAVTTTRDAGTPVVASATVPPIDAAPAPPRVDAAAPRPPARPPGPRPPPTAKPTVIAEESHGPPGFITIDSAPVYAVVFIDGKQYGETPLVHVSLAPGRHVVRAVSPSGAAQTVAINITSGKVAPTRRIEW